MGDDHLQQFCASDTRPVSKPKHCYILALLRRRPKEKDSDGILPYLQMSSIRYRRPIRSLSDLWTLLVVSNYYEHFSGLSNLVC